MKLIIAILGCAAFVTTHAAHASPISAGTWYEFSFTDVGTQARGCFPADPADQALDCIPSAGTPTVFAPAPAWTFTAATFSILTVTDAVLHGDAFDVFNRGARIFSTPMVAGDDTGCGDPPDPVVCLADPLSSHASFVLAPGAQSITITPIAIFDAGAGYFRVTVPEPPGPLLLGTGIAGLFAMGLRRRKHAAFSTRANDAMLAPTRAI